MSKSLDPTLHTSFSSLCLMETSLSENQTGVLPNQLDTGMLLPLRKQTTKNQRTVWPKKALFHVHWSWSVCALSCTGGVIKVRIFDSVSEFWTSYIERRSRLPVAIQPLPCNSHHSAIWFLSLHPCVRNNSLSYAFYLPDIILVQSPYL